MNYDFSAIEKKWQKYWEENNTFHTDVWDFSKPKYYVLDMFPYPSAHLPSRGGFSDSARPGHPGIRG